MKYQHAVGNPCTMSDCLFLFGEYTDVILSISNVEVTLVHNIQYDLALHSLQHYASACIELYNTLPSLDYLSRRLGGPGYCGPPPLPSPCVNLTINSVTLAVRDNPLEAFLQNVYPIWHSSAIERHQRRELMSLKNKDLVAIERDAKKIDFLMRKMDSEYYMKKIKKLEREQILYVAYLIKVHIEQIKVSL